MRKSYRATNIGCYLMCSDVNISLVGCTATSPYEHWKMSSISKRVMFHYFIIVHFHSIWLTTLTMNENDPLLVYKNGRRGVWYQEHRHLKQWCKDPSKLELGQKIPTETPGSLSKLPSSYDIEVTNKPKAPECQQKPTFWECTWVFWVKQMVSFTRR